MGKEVETCPNNTGEERLQPDSVMKSCLPESYPNQDGHSAGTILSGWRCYCTHNLPLQFHLGQEGASPCLLQHSAPQEYQSSISRVLSPRFKTCYLDLGPCTNIYVLVPKRAHSHYQYWICHYVYGDQYSYWYFGGVHYTYHTKVQDTNLCKLPELLLGQKKEIQSE